MAAHPRIRCCGQCYVRILRPSCYAFCAGCTHSASTLCALCAHVTQSAPMLRSLRRRRALCAHTVARSARTPRRPPQVNTASRMESTSLPMRTQVSEDVARLLQRVAERQGAACRFRVEARGIVSVKGKGDMRTWRAPFTPTFPPPPPSPVPSSFPRLPLSSPIFRHAPLRRRRLFSRAADRVGACVIGGGSRGGWVY